MLFYFFYFFMEPARVSLSVDLLCDIIDSVPYYILDGIFIYVKPFSNGDEMNATVMRTMSRIQP